MKKLTNEMAQPLLDAAMKTIKCDLDNLKDKVALHNQRSNLVKPDDTHHNHHNHLVGASSSTKK